MRIVALEEHFSFPSLVKHIDPAAIARRGFPPGGAGGGARNDELKEVDGSRLSLMDEAGISMQVLSVAGPGADIVPSDASPAFASEYNDAIVEVVQRHPDRFAAFAHLPMTAPEAAADELERCISKLGFRGALINGTTDGKFLDDPSFEPILACAESLDVPLYIHPGIPPESVRRAYYDGFDSTVSFLLATAGWGWHSETAIHVLRLVLAGTLDAHPKLKIIIGHMGEGLPAMLARCDNVFGQTKKLARPVSETILDHVAITTSGWFTVPPFLAALLTFGVDRIMFSVDYPFSPNAWGRTFLDQLPITDEDKAKIAHGNADRLLKLETAAAV